MSLRTVMTTACLSVALVATGAVGAEASPRHHHHGGSWPAQIALPNGFQPEGIAIGRAPVAYTGSLADGDIYAADLRTGRGEVVVQGPGTPSVGMKLDRTRLFVAGGPAGTARVVDVRERRVVRAFTFATAPTPTFVNDVVLSKRYAWFTDSQQPRLYRVDRYGRSTAVTTLPLSGDWVQQTGSFNANGIALTPEGRALLVVQSGTGYLFRVDPGTGVARRVDLGGTLLTNGDGLLVRGRTLYAVQNRLNQVAVVRLNEAGTSGVLTRTITSPSFRVPTTVAAYRGSLYLPNARFGVANPETADYDITRVSLRR